MELLVQIQAHLAREHRKQCTAEGSALEYADRLWPDTGPQVFAPATVGQLHLPRVAAKMVYKSFRLHTVQRKLF